MKKVGRAMNVEKIFLTDLYTIASYYRQRVNMISTTQIQCITRSITTNEQTHTRTPHSLSSKEMALLTSGAVAFCVCVFCFLFVIISTIG